MPRDHKIYTIYCNGCERSRFYGTEEEAMEAMRCQRSQDKALKLPCLSIRNLNYDEHYQWRLKSEPCFENKNEEPPLTAADLMKRWGITSMGVRKNTDHGRKDDDGKLRYDLIPPLALEDVVKVLTFGAEKYGPHNWRLVDDHEARYFAAAQRHLWAFRRGETSDNESSLHHLAHAMCCIAFILQLEIERAKTNDG